MVINKSNNVSDTHVVPAVTFPFSWSLKNKYPAKGIFYHGAKVFSCFGGGGGSTMGYKLAGYDVIGFNEIDPKMADCYIVNHSPKHRYIEPIQKFKNRKDLPKELFNLDILDGSPPCSSFSMAGNREKDWGKEKKFREGQQKQVLDTLFFDFIDLAKKLQPKIVISENVPGILIGNSIKYVSKIYNEFKKAGYFTIHKVLDSSKMGVPQKRNRIFFFSVRKDLLKLLPTIDLFNEVPKINLLFNKKRIPFSMIEIINKKRIELRETDKKRWVSISKGSTWSYLENGNKFGFLYKSNLNKVCVTLTTGTRYCHYATPEKLLKKELIQIASFPNDYKFLKNDPQYIMAMSVPPVMIAQIGNRIKEQWLDKIK